MHAETQRGPWLLLVTNANAPLLLGYAEQQFGQHGGTMAQRRQPASAHGAETASCMDPLKYASSGDPILRRGEDTKTWSKCPSSDSIAKQTRGIGPVLGRGNAITTTRSRGIDSSQSRCCSTREQREAWSKLTRGHIDVHTLSHRVEERFLQ